MSINALTPTPKQAKAIYNQKDYSYYESEEEEFSCVILQDFEKKQ